MAKRLFDVAIIGRLTRDVENKEFGGKDCKVIGIAHNFGIKQKDGSWDNVPEYYTVKVWESEIEVPALKKGDSVLVRGSLYKSSYVKDGVKKYENQIRPTSISAVDEEGSEVVYSGDYSGHGETAKEAEADDDSLPF